jgi:hypothetical protein
MAAWHFTPKRMAIFDDPKAIFDDWNVLAARRRKYPGTILLKFYVNFTW